MMGNIFCLYFMEKILLVDLNTGVVMLGIDLATPAHTYMMYELGWLGEDGMLRNNGSNKMIGRPTKPRMNKWSENSLFKTI